MKLLEKQQIETGKIDEMTQLLSVRRILQQEEDKLRTLISETKEKQRVVTNEYTDYVSLYAKKLAPLKEEVETLEARKTAALEPITNLEKIAEQGLSQSNQILSSAEKLSKLVEQKQKQIDVDSLKISEQNLELVDKEKELKTRSSELVKLEKKNRDEAERISLMKDNLLQTTEEIRNKIYKSISDREEKLQQSREHFNLTAQTKQNKLDERATSLDEKEKTLENMAKMLNDQSQEIYTVKSFLDEEKQRLEKEKIHIESKQQTLKAGFDELRKHNKL